MSVEHETQPAPLETPAEPALAAGPRRRTPWPLWIGVCLLLSLAQVLIAGYQLGAGNQTIQIPFLKTWANPSLYPRDAMVQQTLRDYPSFFYRALAWLSRGDIDATYFLLHLATTFAATLAVFALARAMFRDSLAGLIAVLILLAGHHHALAGDDLYSVAFTHTWAVFPLAVLSLALAYRGYAIWAFALAGVIFNLHALTGAYLAFMLGVWALGDVRAIGWRRMLIAPALFALIAAPTAAAMATQHQTFSAHWLDLMYIRSADHSFPSRWWATGNTDLPRYALILALAAVAMSFPTRPGQIRRTLLFAIAVGILFIAGYVLTDLYPIPAVIRAQLFRASRYLEVIALCQIAYGIACALRLPRSGAPLPHWRRWLEALAALAVVATLALPPLLTFLPLALVAVTLVALLSARLSALQASVASAALLLSLVAARAIHFPGVLGGFTLAGSWPNVTPEAGGLLAAALALAILAAFRPRWYICLLGLLTALALYVPWARPLAAQHVTSAADPFIAAQLWARDHTLPDALFLTPTQPGGFRIHSDRSVVNEWRDGTQLYFTASFADTWWTRTTDLQPGLLLSPDGRRLLSRGNSLESLTDQQLIALATRKDIGATYILLPTARASDLTRVYQNPEWSIYTPVLVYRELPAPKDAVNKAEWVAQEKFLRSMVMPNIEKYRKSDLRLQVVDPTGRPVVDLPYELRQTRQDFNFSASLPFFKVPPGDSQGDFKPPAAVDQRELDRFLEVFNCSLIPFSGKWLYIEPVKGKRNYEDLDLYVDWCQKHHVRTEFHFMSGYLPAWMRSVPPAEQKQRFLDHVRDLMIRYGDRIDYWQVINEGVLRGYLPDAVREIRKIKPDAKLGLSYCSKFWNGGSTPAQNRSELIRGIDEIRQLRAQGIQIDYYSTHGHRPFGLWADPRSMYEMFDAARQAGIKVHVTEFFEPVPSQMIGPLRRGGTWTPEEQADYYERMYTICFSHPSVELVNIWGIGPVTWQTGAGLLGPKYEPKPAFTALKTLIHDRFETHATGRLPIDGTIATRAFHGDHELILTLPDGRTAKCPFPVTPFSSAAANQYRLQLDPITASLTLLNAPAPAPATTTPATTPATTTTATK